MINNNNFHDGWMETELRRQASRHQPRLSPEVSARIQNRVYGRLRRALIIQRTIKPAISYFALALLIILSIVGITSLSQISQTHHGLLLTATPLPTYLTPTVLQPTDTPIPSPTPVRIKYYGAFLTGVLPNNMSESSAILSMIGKFNQQHPDYKVILMDNIELSDQTITTLSGQCDCFTWYVPYTYQDVDSVLDINEWISSQEPDFLADFDIGTLDDFLRDGKLVALPATRGPVNVISYNADLLAQRGIQTPSEDWSFDDFIRDISAVASPSENIRGFRLSDMQVFLQARGVQWVNPDADSLIVHINSPEMVSAFEWLASLHTSGAVALETRDNTAALQADIREGKIAFWSSPAGWEDDSFIDNPPRFRIGKVNMPHIEGYRYPIHWYNARGHYISKQSSNIPACWAWIKFLSEQWNTFGDIPARMSVAQSPEWETLVGVDAARVFQLEYERDQRYPTSSNDTKIGQWPFSWWLQKALEGVFSGKDPQIMLNEAQRMADAYLACTAGEDIPNLNGSKLVDLIQTCAKQTDPQWPFSP